MEFMEPSIGGKPVLTHVDGMLHERDQAHLSGVPVGHHQDIFEPLYIHKKISIH